MESKMLICSINYKGLLWFGKIDYRSFPEFCLYWSRETPIKLGFLSIKL